MTKLKTNQVRYYPKAKVVCACGNNFTLGSTKSEIKVDLCSACHPFFTGQMKYIDVGGRVKRFENWMEQVKKSPKKTTKKTRRAKNASVASTKTLKEMLEQAK